MVTDPADYQWSSHNAYLQKRRADWLTVEFVAGLFDTNRRGARLAYARFMTAEPTDTTLQLLRNGILEDDRILGDDSWTKDVLASRDAPVTHRNLDDLVQDTCRRYHVSESALASRSRSRLNSNIRAEIALAATEQGIATVTEVAQRFRRAHSGLSRALNHLRDQQQ